MRLEVSSSNFPRFDRNLNTGAEQATSRELSQPATRYFMTTSTLRRS
jgi:predicted acyl esterase